MQDLINCLREKGFSEAQIKAIIDTVSQWLDDAYPVAGAVISTWMKKETGS